ncbi:MAG TPA: kelch repeat-containing protein, partial [Planctomycetota bacterium]|nr:kelch repeat-containing protein [Planctomycetota bacterium]
GAFDILRNRLVIHGGEDSTSFVLGDTWEYDGATWQQVTSPTSPGPRWAASMAFDVATGTTILFGGSALSGGTPVAETWRWNGTTWTLLQPAQSPPALLAHAMVTDLPNGRIVLFGGRDSSAAQTAQTWTFDGTTWSQLVGPQPPPRCWHDLALDMSTGTVLLYGGWDGIDLGDTWELAGNAWIQHSPAHSPGARRGHRMAWMISLGKVVLHGTAAANDQNDTWAWDGSTWHLLPLTPPYPVRFNVVLQTDWVASRVVMAAGHDDANTTGTVRTLSITVPGAFVPSGAGCPGPAGAPELSGSGFPWVGAMPFLRTAPVPLLGVFVLGASNTMSGGTPLPLPLDPIGMPGCTLQVSLDVLVTATPTGGEAQCGVPIPLLPSLVGFTLHAQAGSLDPGANPLGLTISNALAMMIGGV